MAIESIFSESFYWLAPVLAILTTALAGLINRLFKIEKPWLKQLISWIISIVLAIVTWLIEPALIVYGEPKWLAIIAMAVIVGLSSNGIYDIPTIKNWINTWFEKKPKVEEK